MKRLLIPKLKVSITLLMCLMSVAVFAQTGTLAGKVIDGNNEPIIGATVLVVGTATGTVTDMDGNYSIELPAESVEIAYSFVGYLSETIVITIAEGVTSESNITLVEDLMALEEVVVVGYGAMKKSDLTGAVTTVDSEVLNTRVSSGVDQALQGVAAGVDVTANSGSPGASPTIRIRGTGTVNNADPLFVVDGLMVGNIDFLAPQDVESISVLKDASACAIYGSRGANGVIMITTKKGKTGDPRVSFSTYYGVQSVPNWVSMMNGSQYAEYKNRASFFPVYDPDTVQSTNWLDEITNDGASMYNANLSISGGTEKSTFLLSFGYFQQEGVIKNTNLERYTLRANSEVQVKKWLRIGEDLQLSYRDRDFVSENNTYNSIVSQAMFADPITPIYDAQGNFQPLYTTSDGNPVQKLSEGTLDQNSTDSRLTGQLYAEFSIIEGLTFKSTLGGSAAFGEYYRYVPVYEYGLGNIASDLTNNRRKDLSWQWENYATYTKEIGIHNFTVMAGTSALAWKWDDLSATNTTGPANDDPSMRYFYNWNRENDILSGGADHASMASWLGRVNYSLMDKYLLTASIRRDGSSKFGKDNLYGVFPSVALAWKVSNEPWMQNVIFMNSLKLRGGWGQIGNENIGTGGYVGTVTSGLHYSEGSTLRQGGTALGPPNPGLKWETTISSNIGFDAGFLQNRLLLVFEYFTKDTEDMLYQTEVPATSGIPSTEFPTVNIGTVNNKGVELTLNYRKLEGDFRYDIGGFVSKVVNNVTYLTAPKAAGSYGQGFGPLSYSTIGYPIASFYGYQTDGIFQTYEEVNAHAYQNDKTAPGDFRFKDLNGDGVIDDKDQTVIGSPHPDFTYGFSLNLFYKSFDLGLTFNGVYGGKISAPWKSFSHDALSGVNNMHTDLTGAWTEEAPSTTTPKIGPIDYNQNLRMSDYYLEDATYFRFKTAQLGYTLPEEIAQQLKVSKLRVYVGGQNLLTISDYSGNDPEVGVTGPLLLNVDYGNVPQAKIFTVGLDLSF